MRLFKPYVNWRAIINVIRVLLSSQLAEGEEVKKFEKEFEEKFNKKNVVTVNSGTTALELAYELAGIKKGDEVITPVLTCTATNLPLVRRGCKLVFADIDNDLNVSVEDIKRKITKKTKAIVFVHFGGNNRGLKELVALCHKLKIKLIEDAAQVIGSDYWGKADYTCISLQAIKTLTSGDGGILITKKTSDYQKARRLRWFGYNRELKQKLGDTDLKEAGYKYHMNNITAAIGRGNLAVIDKIISKRKKLMKVYNSYPDIQCHIWLCIQFGKKGEQHHYRNDKYSVFKKFKTDCPNMDRLQDNWRLLPFYTQLSVKQAKKYAR